MNLARLEVLGAVVRAEFHVSRAAKELRQSQPGVSKQLQVLESELGVPLFHRKGRRLLGLTEPGREVWTITCRMLKDAHALSNVASEFQEAETGTLVVATTHTQARYVLPRVVTNFRRLHPKVHLVLHQGSPSQACEEVVSGSADLAIATEAIRAINELVVLPYYEWNRVVIVPEGHPLASSRHLELEHLVRYPLITYAAHHSGRSELDRAFHSKGLVPEIVLSAIDADIIKTYVALGLGVGIVGQMAVSAEADPQLIALDASHLFPPSITSVGLRRGAPLRRFAFDFIEMLSPRLHRQTVEGALYR